MKHVYAVAIVAFVFWALSAIVDTQAYGERETADLRTIPTQYTTSGADRTYRHGDWCVDGRAF